MDSSDSELSDSDVMLQNAFVEGKLKPGLNIEEEVKQCANNVTGMKQKLSEFKVDLEWLEKLECVCKQAPLAPELAAQMLVEQQKRENQLKNNKKLIQYDPANDPVLNDFKRETIFYRQAQATIIEALPKLKTLGVKTKRPEDYFAEMAKTDEHMQKIRENLMKKQEQQKRSERVKELRDQRKKGKQLQVQAKLQRQKEKKDMLAEVKKVRKGVKNDLNFLNEKKPSKKIMEKRRMKDKKFGFGGKKRGLKVNTKASASDVSEYKPSKKIGNKKNRPGKNRRKQNRSRK